MNGDSLVKEFRITTNVQHITGCWGGIVPNQTVLFPREIVRELALANPWLNEFLRHSDPQKTTLHELVESTSGGRKELEGQEFVTRAYLKLDLDDASIDNEKRIVVTSINGFPAESSHKYNHFRTGQGRFQGYSLRPGRRSYSLVYGGILKEDKYEHVEFSYDKPTVIGAHLFEGDIQNLSQRAPTRTCLLIHKPKRN